VPIVVLLECPDVPLRAVEAPDGSRILDICDASAAEVPFSCRSASCGTCRVLLIEGADLLEPPSEDELELLDIFGDDPRTVRLACQARLRVGGGGRLRLKVMPVDE
jgi:ferredoxin